LPYGMQGYGHNVPVIVVVIGQMHSFFDERDRHLIYVDGALATMSFIYALESQGLGSCVVNWPDIDEKNRAMAKTLGLAPDERPVLLIAVGYPDPEGQVASSVKKDVSELLRFNLE